MRPVNEKLAARLLEAGKAEFLEHGFREASLRNIAARLHVTTGAIYRYYADKEALFDALVRQPARELVHRYRQQQQLFAELPLDRQLQDLPEVPQRERAWMMTYIYDHFDAFKLIADDATGTEYEHYLDTLIEIEVNSSRVLMDRMRTAGMALHAIDDSLMHILASTLFTGIFETVRHSMPREKAMDYMESLCEFYTAGWFRILGIQEK